MSLAQMVHFLQDMFQMSTIALVFVINPYHCIYFNTPGSSNKWWEFLERLKSSVNEELSNKKSNKNGQKVCRNTEVDQSVPEKWVKEYSNLIIMIFQLIYLKGVPRCVVANVQECYVIISEFDLYSNSSVYYQINTLWKGTNLFIPLPAMF